MNSPTRWMRVLRGALTAAFATFVASFSHVLGGGAAPSSAGIAVTLALSTLLCIALSGRVLSLWRTSVAVGLSQLLFHGLFSAMPTTGATVDFAPAGTGHAGHMLMPGDVISVPMTATGSHSPWMWLAHTAAAILTVLAIRYAERAFFAVRDAAALVVADIVAAPVPVPLLGSPAPVRVGCSRTILPRDVRLVFSALRHRGPPLFSFA